MMQFRHGTVPKNVLSKPIIQKKGRQKLIMSKDIHNPAVDQLFRAILTLKNVEECYTFFGGRLHD